MAEYFAWLDKHHGGDLVLTAAQFRLTFKLGQPQATKIVNAWIRGEGAA